MSFLPRANTTSIPKHLIPQWDLFCLGIVKSYRALMHRLVELHPNGASSQWGKLSVETVVLPNARIIRLIYEEPQSFFVVMNDEADTTVLFDMLVAQGNIPAEWRKIPHGDQFVQFLDRQEFCLDGKSDMFVDARRSDGKWKGGRMEIGSPELGIWRRLLAFTEGRYDLKCGQCLTVLTSGTRADMESRAEFGKNTPCFYCGSKEPHYKMRRDEDFVDFDIEEQA